MSTFWTNMVKHFTDFFYLLKQDGFYLLLEDGGKIILENTGPGWSNQTKN